MKDLIRYRREFHKYAETSWNEVRTSARIAEILEKSGVETVLTGEEVIDTDTIKPPVQLSRDIRDSNMERALLQGALPGYVRRGDGIPGVIGVIDTGRPGPVWALRFDIDALPYDEDMSVSHRPAAEGFASVNGGAVHACGHDGHAAIGIGLANLILSRREDFRGRIKLIFQPAEETFFGAASIVNRGHLDDADLFAAVHLALSAENEPLPSHSLACAVNDFLSVRQLDITFHGKAAHPCGAAQEGRNALLAACAASLALHCIPPHEKGLTRVNVGRINGGLCSNTIADECSISLEYRGQFPEISDYLQKRVFEILDGTSAAYGVKYTYTDYGQLPAARSSAEAGAAVREASRSVPWFETVWTEGNLGGSDDASVMMNHVQKHGGKAVYMGIGCDTSAPLHNASFDFDEDCLKASVLLLGEMIRQS